jgi:hypothetical protein
MNKKLLSFLPTVALFVIIAAVFVALIYATQMKTTSVESETNVPQEQSQSITLSIEGIYEDKQVPLETGETLLLLLERLEQMDPQLQLSTKTYEMGTLVESLGGLTNGSDNKYWQFEVDGVAPMIGAHAYTLLPGQKVVWQFKESTF